MGTAGPLALAREALDDGSDEPFFVLNRRGPHPWPLEGVVKWRGHLTGRGSPPLSPQKSLPPAHATPLRVRPTPLQRRHL